MMEEEVQEEVPIIAKKPASPVMEEETNSSEKSVNGTSDDHRDGEESPKGSPLHNGVNDESEVTPVNGKSQDDDEDDPVVEIPEETTEKADDEETDDIQEVEEEEPNVTEKDGDNEVETIEDEDVVEDKTEKMEEDIIEEEGTEEVKEDVNIEEKKVEEKQDEEKVESNDEEKKEGEENVTNKEEEGESKKEEDEGEASKEEDKKPEEEKKTPSKKNKKKEVIPQTPTRQSSRIKRPAKYVEEEINLIEDVVVQPSKRKKGGHVDDDIEITGEILRRGDDDVEMLEEKDPLAISESDVRKERQKKKDSGVIVIDTHTLLRNQGNLQAAVAQSAQGGRNQQSPAVNLQTMQNAIHAITNNSGNSNLHNAYIAAIQQDDAYVIEAPSFIVPYVMEGKPKEPIKTFLKRINKEQDAFEKKQELEKKDKKDEKVDDTKEKDGTKEKDDKEDKKDKDDKEDDDEDKEDTKDKEDKEDDDTEKEKEEEKSEEAKVDEEKKEGEEEEKMEVDEDKDKKAKKEEETEEDKEKKDEEKMETDKDEESEEKKEGEAKKDEDSEETEESDKKSKKRKADDLDKEEGEDDSKDKENKENNAEDKIDQDFSHLGRWEGFYKSNLGKFFLDLGLSQAQQFIQSDLLRMQKRRMDKLKSTPSYSDLQNIKNLERQLEQRKKENEHLHVRLITCKFCNFKTESELVMDRHLESPHMVNYTYKCNFCDFETRGPQVILYHMETQHCVRGRLERAPAFFKCPLCPYEDNNKSKMTRHSFSCAKKFKPDKNCDLSDWEPPAKIPKVNRGRPNPMPGKYEPVKMPNILPKGFAGMNLSQLPQSMVNSLMANASQLAAGRGRGRPVGSYKSATQMMAAARSLGSANAANLLLQNTRGNNLLQQVTAQQYLSTNSSITAKSITPKGAQQPSISITALPRSAGNTPTQSKSSSSKDSGSGGKQPSFVICEICDGYIKDLEQLRNHMHLIHKVKIHPKMIYNRPPLNCQKCQHRFFTDQGLERHLLGTHGLVTSSMQEAANKGKDAGRCPICGKVFQWKLLNHVSRDHKMTLKPAHLSYKCTVCTATFNMYRLFENHVYSAHSVVSKNKGEGGSNSSKKVNGNDSALKINDEITIIPQPSSKNKDKLSSSKSTPQMSKEITITKVGTTPAGPASSKKKANGGGVEIISLDDSPVKRSGDSKKAKPKDITKKSRASPAPS